VGNVFLREQLFYHREVFLIYELVDDATKNGFVLFDRHPYLPSPMTPADGFVTVTMSANSVEVKAYV
jgi:hypothetical protein